VVILEVLTKLLAPLDRRLTVNYVGCDLHKKTIVLCVMNWSFANRRATAIK
jgi:hypothetical protein